jgi:ASTRA-associated protein 1
MGWEVSNGTSSSQLVCTSQALRFDAFLPRIRLYSTRTLKPLGTLDYHKGGCQTVVFARSLQHTALAANVERELTGDDSEDEDEMDEEEKRTRARWLVGGGKDHRVSIWVLMTFGSSGS